MQNRVREARLQRKMTMSELAKASGVSQSFISEIETGKHEPKVRRALRIARLLERMQRICSRLTPLKPRVAPPVSTIIASANATCTTASASTT